MPVFLATVAQACGGDRARLARVLAGLKRYQAAPLAGPRPIHPEIARIGNVSLRAHADRGQPLVIVPSLINPAFVVDLTPGNSLLESLAAAGFRPLLVDWGETEPHGLASAVTDRLMPLIAGLGEPVALAGYCLGGTLALAAAALLGPRVSRLALLATPWHFSGYDGAARAGMSDWWQGAAPLADSLRAMPIDLLQPAFWALDGDAVAAKYESFAALPDGPAANAFIRLEDWSNTGQPLSLATAHDLAETLFRDDQPGRGTWTIAGQRIDAAAITCPILDVIAVRDRIVPAAAALTTNGPGTALRVDAGHVGMVVGRRAPAMLWHPLAQWLGAGPGSGV